MAFSGNENFGATVNRILNEIWELYHNRPVAEFLRNMRLRRQRKWFFEHYHHPDETYFHAVMRWIRTGDTKCAD